MSQLFSTFAELCQRLAETTRKLAKREMMAEYLRGLDLADAARAAQWLSGEPFSATDRRALNMGGSSLQRVLKEVSGADDRALHAAYRRHGDIGGAAFELLESRSAVPSTITLEDVDAALDAIAGPPGKPQIAATKLRVLRDLLVKATALETKYLVKLISGDMRIGVKQAQVEEAIGVAFERELKQLRDSVMLLGDLRKVVAMAAADTLGEARMKLFHPLGFMLASPVETVDEALDRFGTEVPEGTDDDVIAQALLEDKFDGIRAQLHCGDPEQPGRVALFSRSRDDMTESFPEIAEAFSVFTKPVILDGELLAWTQPTEEDPGRALPFSSLQQRIGRKKVTEEMRKATPVVFMAFDLLYADGELLLDRPLIERRSALTSLFELMGPLVVAGSKPKSIVSSSQGGLFADMQLMSEDNTYPRLILSPAIDLQSAEQLDLAYAEARARGNEGVMLKAKNSLYQPGRRGLAWLKLKRELATLDVVVTSAEWGHGRRAQTLSDVTFAVRDGDELKNVGKAYSGLTDVEIEQLTAWFLEHTLEDFGSWRAVEPKIVLEVAFNNLMRSDRHASGFAMRFPRILRIRGDKPADEIDTLQRVEEIYNGQPDKPVEAIEQ
jgi:DNA ligase-1